MTMTVSQYGDGNQKGKEKKAGPITPYIGPHVKRNIG